MRWADATLSLVAFYRDNIREHNASLSRYANLLSTNSLLEDARGGVHSNGDVDKYLKL